MRGNNPAVYIRLLKRLPLLGIAFRVSSSVTRQVNPAITKQFKPVALTSQDVFPAQLPAAFSSQLPLMTL